MQLAVLEIPIVVKGANLVGQQLAQIRGLCTSLSTNIQAIGTAGENVPKTAPLQAGASAFQKITDEAQNAGNSVLQFAGIDLSGIIAKFGALGAVVGGIAIALGLAVKAGLDFTKSADEKALLAERIKLTGQNATEAMGKIEAYANEMKKMGVAAGETRKAVGQLVTRGMPVDQAINTARAGHDLSAALGSSQEHATRLVTMYQEMGTQALRRDPIFRAMIRNHASEVEIQEKLNSLIKQGGEIAKFRLENTTEGQILQLKAALNEMWGVMKSIFGPPMQILIGTLSQSIRFLVGIFQDWWKQSSIAGSIREIFASLQTIIASIFNLFKSDSGGASAFVEILDGAFTILEAILWIIKSVTKMWADLTRDTGKSASGWKEIFVWVKKIVDTIMLLNPLALISKIKKGLGLGGEINATAEGGAGSHGASALTPGGLGTKSSLTSVEKLWEKVSLAGVEGNNNPATRTAIGVERLNQTVEGWSANGMPVRNVGPAAAPVPG